MQIELVAQMSEATTIKPQLKLLPLIPMAILLNCSAQISAGQTQKIEKTTRLQDVYFVIQPEKTLVYGLINGEFVEALQKAVDRELPIHIASPGGTVLHSVKAAEIIKKHKPIITIDTFCFSGCAEFLIVEASKYQVIGNKGNDLIGYHHNPAISRIAMLSDLELFNDCFSAELRLFQKMRGESDEFIKIQVEKISLLKDNPFYIFGEDCKSVRIQYKNDFWLPNSELLAKHLGIRFKKEICADLGAKKCLDYTKTIPAMPTKTIVF